MAVRSLIDLVRRFPIIIIVPIIAVGWLVVRDHLPGHAEDLRVGDCFNQPAVMEDIQEVQHRPCSEAHDAEVFAVLDHPAGPEEPYPVVYGVDDFVRAECVPLFTTYTGVAYESQMELDIGWLYPTFVGWGEGDREVTCYLVGADGQLTASRRASP